MLAAHIAAALGDEACRHPEKATLEILRQAFVSSDALVCIMAAGIVVRALGPICRDKWTDPCVIVIDERGEYVVSLLSGHHGGGNELARRIAAITGGKAVITTASDVLGRTAVDLWAERNGFQIRSERKLLTTIAARLVNHGVINFFSNCRCTGVPKDFHIVDSPAKADIVLTCNEKLPDGALCFSPRNLVVGIGCNRGTSVEEIGAAVAQTCRQHDLHEGSIGGIATIDAKIGEEGLVRYAATNGLPLRCFTKERLNRIPGITESVHALAAVGAKGVAEPAAMLAAASGDDPGQLIVGKMKWNNVTTAVAARNIVCVE
ncbi:MAG: cobalamin biosynthesis protein [Desulfoprunum sp.]